MRTVAAAALVLPLALSTVALRSNHLIWGAAGHLLVGQAAAGAIPAQMPDFFRKAAPQLAYLNPEPDRWRDRAEISLDPAMDGDHSPEHFIDLEQVPGNALRAPNRYAYLDSIHNAGQKGSGPGLLPFMILEYTQLLREDFRLWRAAKDPATRSYIEERIVNDAGILGHFVADGSNPHHTTENHDGWVSANNPEGFSAQKGFHSRFETQYVESHMAIGDVQPLVRADPHIVAPVRDSILAYLNRTFAQLNRLYELDKAERFSNTTKGADHKQFTAERLAAGATMLRDCWWTAWVTSTP